MASDHRPLNQASRQRIDGKGTTSAPRLGRSDPLSPRSCWTLRLSSSAAPHQAFPSGLCPLSSYTIPKRPSTPARALTPQSCLWGHTSVTKEESLLLGTKHSPQVPDTLVHPRASLSVHPTVPLGECLAYTQERGAWLSLSRWEVRWTPPHPGLSNTSTLICFPMTTDVPVQGFTAPLS